MQVNKDDILRYTGEGKPPRVVMLFSPVSDKTKPPDLQMIATFGAGVSMEPNIFQLHRKAETW